MLTGSSTKKFNIVSIHHGWMQIHDFFCFRPEIPFLAKLVPKIKIRICRSQGDVNFFCFWPEIPYLGKLDPNLISLSWNLLECCYLSTQKSMMMFTVSVFSQKYLLWKKYFLQKIKIVSLSWYLVPRLIQICRTQGCCSLLFSFWLEIPFLSKFGQKKSKLSV